MFLAFLAAKRSGDKTVSSSDICAPMSLGGQLNGLFRAAHRFPALANAVSVALFAAFAGATTQSVLLISLSMLLVHAAIGSSNDVVDVEDDRRTQPNKPIVLGLVSVETVRIAAVVEGTLALILALSVNFGSFLVILAILISGLAYNFWAKRTILSWLPYAVFIPSVVTAGFFAADAYEPSVMIAYLIGALVAIALNLANSIPDLEGDRANGVKSLATVLGVRRSYFLTWTTLSLSIGGLWLFQFATNSESPMFLMLSAAMCVLAMVGLALRSQSTDARRMHWYMTAVCAVLIGAAFVVSIR